MIKQVSHIISLGCSETLAGREREDRMSDLSTMMADIEDPSLLMESLDLSEEDVKTHLLVRFYAHLWEEYQDLEVQSEQG